MKTNKFGITSTDKNIISRILEGYNVTFNQVLECYPSEHVSNIWHVILDVNNDIQVWDVQFSVWDEIYPPVLNVIKTLEYRREQLNK